MNYYRGSKYKAKKVEFNGIKFDSIKECRRYRVLLEMEKSGQIKDLELQKKFTLIPSQYIEINGKKKCIERECTYIADFVYKEGAEIVVEDTKGFKTKDYIIKRKLMLKIYGIQIKEV